MNMEKVHLLFKSIMHEHSTLNIFLSNFYITAFSKYELNGALLLASK